MAPATPSSFLPLSPAMLHILLALAAEDRHGYAILQEIRQHSQGQYKIGPGTLYDNLERMMNQDLVEEAQRAAHRAGRDEAQRVQRAAKAISETRAATPDPFCASFSEDPRRRYYRLTRLGRSVLTAEVNRLEDIIRQAKTHLRPALGRRS